MSRWLLIALFAIGCAKTTKKETPVDSADIDDLIHALLDPRSGPGRNASRREALEALLERPDEAHPRLLALAEEDPHVVVLTVLPRFGRPESVPVLERVLREGPDEMTVTAGQALAAHPHPSALEALITSLSSDRPQTVASAADGLTTRADPSAREALEAARARQQGEVRDRIQGALDALPGG